MSNNKVRPDDSSRFGSKLPDKSDDWKAETMIRGVDEYCLLHTSIVPPTISRRPLANHIDLGETNPNTHQLTALNGRYCIDQEGMLTDLKAADKQAGARNHEGSKPADFLGSKIRIEAPKIEQHNKIDWKYTIFIPNSCYFIILGTDRSSLRSVDRPNEDISTIEHLCCSHLKQESYYRWYFGEEQSPGVVLHNPSHLILFAADGVRLVDMRCLFSVENVDLSFPLLFVRYPDNVGELEYSDKAIAINSRTFMINQWKRGGNDYSPITCCFELNSDDWSAKSAQPLTINQIDLPQPLHLTDSEALSWEDDGEKYILIHKVAATVVRQELSYDFKSMNTCPIIEDKYRFIEGVRSFLQGRIVAFCHQEGQKKCLVVYCLADDGYSLILEQELEYAAFSLSIIPEFGELLVDYFKYVADEKVAGIVSFNLGRWLLHQPSAAIHLDQENSCFSSFISKDGSVMKVGDKTVIRANKHLYISQTDGSYRKIYIPLPNYEHDSCTIYCPQNESIYMHELVEEEEGHILSIVKVDMKTQEAQLLEKHKIDNDRVCCTIDMITAASIQRDTIAAFHLDGRSLLVPVIFDKTDRQIRMGADDFYIYDNHTIDYQLLHFSSQYVTESTVYKIYQDQYIHMKSSNTGRYVCVMHHDTRQLYLMDTKSIKPEDKFIDIGIEFTTHPTFTNLFTFSDDDSKLGMFVDFDRRYIFDLAQRHLTRLNDVSWSDPSFNMISLAFDASCQHLFIWQEQSVEYYLAIHRYHKHTIQVKEMKYVRHVQSDENGTKIYGTDRYGNVLVKDLDRWLSADAKNIVMEEGSLDLLMENVNRYQNANKDTDKKRIGGMVKNVMKKMASVAPHTVDYIIAVCFYLNDVSVFREFVAEAVSIEKLIKRYSFLHLCMMNNHMREHLESVEAFVDEQIEMIRYDWELIEAVGLFVREIQISDIGDQYLSSKSSRSIIKQLLLLDTGQEVTVELKDLDAPVLYLDREPKTAPEEKQAILEAVPRVRNREQKNAEEYRVFRTVVEVDMRSGSIDSILFFNLLRKFPDSDMKSLFKPLSYHKYKQMFMYLLTYALMDWTCSVLLYLFLGFHFEANWRRDLLVPIWVILGLKAFFEVCGMVSDWRKYFSDIWNYFDILLLAFTCLTSIAVDSLAQEAASTSWLVVLRLVNMMMAIWRSVTWLRVFKPTRYLVTMILAVFAKMVYFLIILITFIVAYAFMWRVTLSLREEQGESEMSFYTSLLYSIDIIFGNSANLTEDGQNVSVIQAIVHSLGNVLIALALLNFLIAIISGVYEEVNEEKELYDVKELMLLISEFDNQHWGFIFILSWPFVQLKKQLKKVKAIQKCTDRCFPQKIESARKATSLKYYVLLPKDPIDDLTSIQSTMKIMNEALAEQSVLLQTIASQQRLLGEKIEAQTDSRRREGHLQDQMIDQRFAQIEARIDRLLNKDQP